MGELILISVARADRRVDLAVPGSLPVVELLPDLVEAVGEVEGATGPPVTLGALRLVSSTGECLVAGTGLAEQGVRDGQVLTLVPDHEVVPAPHEDPAEAMAEAVAEVCLPWHHLLGRPAALSTAVAFLVAGLAALGLAEERWAGSAAAAVTVVLVAAATRLDRARGEGAIALLAGWVAVGYASVAGGLLGGVPAAGAAACAIGLVLGQALVVRRLLVIPAVAAGAVVAVLGVLDAETSLDTGFLAAVALASTVVLAPSLPRIALAVAEVEGSGAERDLTRTAGRGHDLLRALEGTVALLGLVLIPVVLGTGLAGLLLAVVTSLLQVVRSRHHHSAAEILLIGGSGISGLVVVAGSVLLLRPEWAAYVGVAAAVAGLLAPVAVLRSGPVPLRARLVLDQLEGLLLITVFPLLVFSAGVVETVRGLTSR